MSTVIHIPEKIFKRLQKLAVPFEDTPASVIERLLDFHDRHGGREMPVRPKVTSPGPSENDGDRQMDPDRPASLSHTKIIQAEVDGRPASNWNDVVHLTHRVAMENAESFENLSRLTNSNIVEGCRTDKGFQHLPEIDVSIQNVNANDAWKSSYHLAQQISVSISIRFKWLDNDAAAYPGEVGTLNWAPEAAPGHSVDTGKLRWADEVTRALEKLDGTGTLSEIYEQIRLVRSDLSPEWKATVRQTIETHSSDSDNFTGGADYYYSVSGIGQGRWGLRPSRSQ